MTFIDRQQDRRIAVRELCHSQSRQGYTPFFEYEAHILIRSLCYVGEMEKNKKWPRALCC